MMMMWQFHNYDLKLNSATYVFEATNSACSYKLYQHVSIYIRYDTGDLRLQVSRIPTI